MAAKVTAVPDLGDTRAELVKFVNGAVDILGNPLMGRVMQGLVSEVATNPELGESVRDRVVGARLTEARRIVDRGIERGDVRTDIDYELAHELLFGPVYYRLLLSGGALDRGSSRRACRPFPARLWRVTIIDYLRPLGPERKASRVTESAHRGTPEGTCRG
jgi:Tetracyclin repressor-like, C-terminal domain